MDGAVQVGVPQNQVTLGGGGRATAVGVDELQSVAGEEQLFLKGIIGVAHGAHTDEGRADLPGQLVPEQGQRVRLGSHPVKVRDAVAVAAAVAVEAAVVAAPVQVHSVVGAEPGGGPVPDQDVFGGDIVHGAPSRALFLSLSYQGEGKLSTKIERAFDFAGGRGYNISKGGPCGGEDGFRGRERRSAMERVIFHCDLNSFYASVELLDHPELRHLPVAVCGDPESRHGIILAKNELAKRFQVQTAETIWQAKRKCPDLVLLPAHHRVYREFSRRINRMYQDYTDLVEPFGIDESWLDVSGTLHLFGGDPGALADEIRRRMRQEFGLTISVGISFNKVFAKLGSDYKKPDATTWITRENFQQLVWPLPVGDLLYVGRAAAETMKKIWRPHHRGSGPL